MCHTFNDNMKTAERSAETFFFAHSGISEANLHPHMIPNFDEKVTMAPVLSADPSSALLVSTPLRGGPASTAIAATSQGSLAGAAFVAVRNGTNEGLNSYLSCLLLFRLMLLPSAE